jgi:hypothetical protein
VGSVDKGFERSIFFDKPAGGLEFAAQALVSSPDAGEGGKVEEEKRQSLFSVHGLSCPSTQTLSKIRARWKQVLPLSIGTSLFSGRSDR